MDDPERGYLLELMLTKLRFAAAGVSQSENSSPEGLQVYSGSSYSRLCHSCLIG